jgi:GMP synthase (glutamine-hydrolysing)
MNNSPNGATRPDPSAVEANDLLSERVLVLDFGAQYAQLIARRVRDQNVYCELIRHDVSAEVIMARKPSAIILSGGPASVYEANAPKCDPRIFSLGIPILGICYGMQLASQALGGAVEKCPAREFGRSRLAIASMEKLFAGFPHEIDVWMSHGDQVHALPAEFETLASTSTCPFAAVKHKTKPIYGLQFHPEVSHTALGGTLIHNFLYNIANCDGKWHLSDFAHRSIESIRKTVGSDRVICGLSGGVDSAVTAALIYKAIGSQLTCILIDNGLLRKDEQAAVISEFTLRPWPAFAILKKNEGALGTPLSIASSKRQKRSTARSSLPKERFTLTSSRAGPLRTDHQPPSNCITT